MSDEPIELDGLDELCKSGVVRQLRSGVVGTYFFHSIFFVVATLAATPAQAHCTWRHLGHCISGGIDEIGDIGEDILDFGGDVFDRGLALADELPVSDLEDGTTKSTSSPRVLGFYRELHSQ